VHGIYSFCVRRAGQIWLLLQSAACALTCYCSAFVASQEKHFGVGHVLAVDGQAADVVTIILDGECQLVKKGHTSRHSSSCVNTEFTSGFKTRLDVCQVGLIGARSLVGDISVLLSVPEPATVICSTAVHALQCRASVFLDQLQLPGQQCVALYTKYCLHAKLKLDWLQARGSDVDDLLGFQNLSLLINTEQDAVLECGPTAAANTGTDKAGVVQSTAATCSKLPGAHRRSSPTSVLLPDEDDSVKLLVASPTELAMARRALRNAPSLSTMSKTSIAWQKDASSAQPMCTQSRQHDAFLEPFPTLTRRRSLHAVSQPVVRHTQAVGYTIQYGHSAEAQWH
jgi:hypothetical protein